MNKVHVDVKTTDGDELHLCFVGFTKKHKNQIWKTSHSAPTNLPKPEDDLQELVNTDSRQLWKRHGKCLPIYLSAL